MKKKRSSCGERTMKLVILLIMAALAAGSAYAATVPTYISYQGKLANQSTGNAITPASMLINITELNNFASVVWNSTFNDVVDSQGVFNLVLGKNYTLNLTAGRDYQLVALIDYGATTFAAADVIFGDGQPSGDEIIVNAGGPSDATELVMSDNVTSVEAKFGNYTLRSGDNMTGGLNILFGGFNASGSVLFNGTTGTTPTSGAGTRLMWIPALSAFRAGYVGGTQWDDVNLGYYSFASGSNATASGNYSTAMGYTTNASGEYSTAMGGSTTASGNYSTAMGVRTRASVDGSTAMGMDTTASGDVSTAMGDGTTASGFVSTAMGYLTRASGQYSTAMGGYTIASAMYSTAMGYYSTASGNYSTAMGYRTTASGNDSTAMGWQTTASGASSTAEGYLTIASGNYSTAIGRDIVCSKDNATCIGGGFVGLNTGTPRERLDVNGSAIIGNYKVNISGSGDVNATKFYGDGSALTGITSGGIQNGTAASLIKLNASGLDISGGAVTNTLNVTTDLKADSVFSVGYVITGTAYSLGETQFSFLDGTDQSVYTTSSPRFAGLSVNGKINGSSLNISGGATIQSLNVTNDLQVRNLTVNIGTGINEVNLSGVLYVNGTAGRVGIGILAPTAALDIVSQDTVALSLTRYISSGVTGSPISFRAVRGTPTAPSQMLANDQLLGFGVSGWQGGGAFTTGGNRVFYAQYAAENWNDATHNGAYITLATTHRATGGSGTTHNHMTLTPSGTLWLGEGDNSPVIDEDFVEVSKLHLDMMTGQPVNMRFTANATTGRTASDGFTVGINATGVAELRQWENLPMEFYVNNTLAISIVNSSFVNVTGNAAFGNYKVNISSTGDVNATKFYGSNITLGGTVIPDNACGVVSGVFWGEQLGTLSTSDNGGLQFSQGDTLSGSYGNSHVCSGTVKSLSMICKISGANVGRVEIAIDGVAQGTGCEVASPNSAYGKSSDTSCDTPFAANSAITTITTTSDAATEGCTTTWGIRYD